MTNGSLKQFCISSMFLAPSWMLRFCNTHPNQKKSNCVWPPHPKGWLCFGPHALTPGFMESRNRRVFVAQIPQICTTESRLSVSPEIPQYSAWLYPQSHFPQIERTCHLTIGFHPNSVSSIQDEAWTTYSSCLLSNIERLLIGKCLGGIPRTSEHDLLQFL